MWSVQILICGVNSLWMEQRNIRRASTQKKKKKIKYRERKGLLSEFTLTHFLYVQVFTSHKSHVRFSFLHVKASLLTCTSHSESLPWSQIPKRKNEIKDTWCSGSPLAPWNSRKNSWFYMRFTWLTHLPLVIWVFLFFFFKKSQSWTESLKLPG